MFTAKMFTRTRRLLLLAALTLPALSGPAIAQQAAENSPPRVTLDEARALHDRGEVMLFDIREPQEHATGVAAGAHLLPLSQIRQRVREIPNNPDQPVLIICNTQNRSGRLVQALRQSGWTNVRFVHGGMSEWARRQWPMVKPGSESGHQPPSTPRTQ